VKLLVIDEQDEIKNFCDKLIVHYRGMLHRAFSVFIFNEKNELLMQQRALHKYHSGGLWSNTCCSHFTSGKNLYEQAEKRLFEEMGINCQLNWIFNYRYKVSFENGLTENELVYTYFGFSNALPLPAKEEVSDWRWVDIILLQKEIKSSPDKYTYWFKFVLDDFVKAITNRGLEKQT